MRKDLLQIQHKKEDDFEQITRITNHRLIADLFLIIKEFGSTATDKQYSDVVEKVREELRARANLYIDACNEFNLRGGDISIIAQMKE